MRPTDFDILSIFDTASPTPSTRFVYDMLVHKGFYAKEPFITAYKHTLGVLKSHGRIKQDPRRTYTIAELSNLMLMSPAQRADFAKRTGRSMRAVYAAVDRHRKALDKVTRSDNQIAAAGEFIHTNDHFNFANPAHLQLLNITSKQMRSAQKYLRSEGLYLRNPNYLYNQRDEMLLKLTKTQQIQLIKYPVDFVDKTLPLMGHLWENVCLDPAQDDAFEVPEDIVDLGLSRPRRTRSGARVARAQEQFVKAADKLTRNMRAIGPVPRESDMYIRAVELQRVLSEWIANPIEVVTDVEFNKIGTYDESGRIITAARYAADQQNTNHSATTYTTQSKPNHNHNQDTAVDLSEFFAAAEALNNGTLGDDEETTTNASGPAVTDTTPPTSMANFALDLGL